LFAYAILRSIPSKLGGVIALMASILVILVIPFIGHGHIRGCKFYSVLKFWFWWLVVLFVLLTWAGAQVVEAPYINLSQALGVLYFSMFLGWGGILGLSDYR